MRDYAGASAGSQSSQWTHSAHENDGLSRYGSRDLIGTGGTAPTVKWPKNAKVALSIVINYEEGGERCILHGDTESESLIVDAKVSSLDGERNVNVESMYDYGSRAGFWRLHRLFLKKKVPVTVFAVGMALERNPVVCQALKERSDWEIASHGYRWIDYGGMEENEEKEHIKRAVKIHERLLGKRPMGFYQGKPSVNTRKLIVEEGGFKYDSDSYADDLPYWSLEYGKPHLIIPYSLTENDMRFCSDSNFPTGIEFGNHLKETLRYAVEEGKAGHPIVMSVGLHCRLARPGRVQAISDFLDFVRSYGSTVWLCTREQIADHWAENHYPRGAGSPVKAGVGGMIGVPDVPATASRQEDGDFI